MAVADSCRAAAWWCAALTGYTHHVAGHYAAADSAYRIAMDAMDGDRHCRWNDLRRLLESKLEHEYRRLSCTQRDSANAHLAWLANPRPGAAGQLAWTEVLARRTYAAILEDAVTHHGTSFGDDIEEIVLRYGWATAFSRRPRAVTSSSPPSVIGHEPKPAYAFLPKTLEGDSATWDLTDATARARFHTPWAPLARWMDDAQWARFRRGDRSLVTVTFTADWDTVRTSGPSEATLVLSRGPWDEQPPVGRTEVQAGRGVLVASTGPGARLLAALEVRDSGTGAILTNRVLLRALPAPTTTSRPVVSDILLFHPGETLPGSLSEAVAMAHPGVKVPERGRIGLYWEVYGVAETDSVGVTLAVEETRPGFLTRVARTLGVTGRPQPIRLSWTAAEGGEGVMAQAIEVDLAPLGTGRYEVILRFTGPKLEGLEAKRGIEVLSTGGGR